MDTNDFCVTADKLQTHFAANVYDICTMQKIYDIYSMTDLLLLRGVNGGERYF